MQSRVVIVIGATCAFALAACASKQEAAPAPAPAAAPAVSQRAAVVDTPSGGAMAENTVTMTATVQKVDMKTRMVTLKGPDGKVVTIHADDRVKNLAQVKKGDTVTMTYYESLAYDLLKPGQAAPGVAVAGDVIAAKPGEKPGVAGAQAVTVTAKITAINKKTQQVTLRGPRGKSVTVKVKDPTRLDNVKVGDLVQVTYTEALAVAVEAASKK